jgi:two-component system, chemotaxis family, sensor kinase CheA
MKQNLLLKILKIRDRNEEEAKAVYLRHNVAYILTLVFLPLYGLVLTFFDHNFYDPMSFRLVSCLQSTLFLLVSQKIKSLTIRSWMMFLHVQITTGFVFWITGQNLNHIAYVGGSFMTFTACMLCFDEYKQTVYFAFLSILYLYFFNTNLVGTLIPDYALYLFMVLGFLFNITLIYDRHGLVSKLKDLNDKLIQKSEELFQANVKIDQMINSIDQGMLVFDEKGAIDPTYTQACERIFETSLRNKDIFAVLRFNSESAQSNFKTWVNTAFKNLISFDSLLDLAPKELITRDDQTQKMAKYIGLKFSPIYNDKQEIERIVLLSSDLTKEKQAELELATRKEEISRISKIIENKYNFVKFRNEIFSYADEVNKLVSNLKQTNLLDLKRNLHTIKGGLGIYYFQAAYKKIDELEQGLQEVTDLNDVKPDVISKAMNFVKEELELLISNNKSILGREIVEGTPFISVDLRKSMIFSKRLEELKLVEVKKEFDKEFYYLYIKNYFTTYEELVNSLAKKLGKRILPFNITQERLMIPPFKFDDFFTSLVHVFRNIVDHAIELPSERVKAAKNDHGEIRIHYQLVEEKILMIKIEDDGRGMDPEKLKISAKSKGLDLLSKHKQDQDIFSIIFEPMFSTKEEQNDLSGRGIGLSAVKYEVDKLGGEIFVASTVGSGTSFEFRIPILN